MKRLQQVFQVKFTYDVLFTHDLFAMDNPVLRDVLQQLTSRPPARVWFVIDQGVTDRHPALVAQIDAYLAASPRAEPIAPPRIIAGGEASKNDPALVDALLTDINRYGIDRHAYIIAVGGGALLDMVGYAAAIAHRGVRHIRIPTTVLAQNDSGVGVKNSINYFGKKNFLGTFTPPVAVINDLRLLETLSDRDWRAGMSEAVKVSLIKDREFFEYLEAAAPQLRCRDAAAMERLIYDCARLHLQHIAGGDPFEKGSSRPLDFGHWAAHKLEQLTDYDLRHGEAVAIGIALDATYSYHLGSLAAADWERVLTLLRELGFELYHPALHHRQGERLTVLAGLDEFREHLGGELTIMLLDGLGSGYEVHAIDAALMEQSMNTLRQLHVAGPLVASR